MDTNGTVDTNGTSTPRNPRRAVSVDGPRAASAATVAPERETMPVGAWGGPGIAPSKARDERLKLKAMAESAHAHGGEPSLPWARAFYAALSRGDTLTARAMLIASDV